MIILADDDCLYAIDVETGKRKWKFETDEAISNALTLSKDEKSVFISDAKGTAFIPNIVRITISCLNFCWAFHW